LLALTSPQQTMVYENAGQSLTNGALHDGGRNCRINPAREPTNRSAVTDLPFDASNQLTYLITSAPIWAQRRKLSKKVDEYLLTPVSVDYLRVKLHPG
jgi:hypothetical protein